MARNADRSKCSLRSAILNILRQQLGRARLHTKRSANWVLGRHEPEVCNDHAQVKSVYQEWIDAYNLRMFDESGCEGYN